MTLSAFLRSRSAFSTVKALTYSCTDKFASMDTGSARLYRLWCACGRPCRWRVFYRSQGMAWGKAVDLHPGTISKTSNLTSVLLLGTTRHVFNQYVDIKHSSSCGSAVGKTDTQCFARMSSMCCITEYYVRKASAKD